MRPSLPPPPPLPERLGAWRTTESAGTFLGPYAYCELPPESFYLVVGGAALPAAGACTEGYLPPGGVLRLAAPGG